MKMFLYCEDAEGGMSHFIVAGTASLNGALRGWGTQDCAAEDGLLTQWMATAEVGDFFEHRIGVCIRLRDANPG